MADGYEAWDAAAPGASSAPGAQSPGYSAWDAGIKRDETESVDHLKAAVVGVGAGAAAGIAAFLGRKFGIRPTKEALSSLDSAFKKDFGGKGLKEMWTEYKIRAADVGNTKFTFADHLSQIMDQSGDFAPNTLNIMKKSIGESGRPALIGENLMQRGSAQKSRVLDDLSQHLGVPRETLNETMESLMASRKANAKPLYEAAFKDKSPIRDTNLLSLFGDEIPRGAMMEALKQVRKNALAGGKDIETLFAADPSRKNAWNKLLTTDVPEHMFAGEEWAKQRPYFAPTVRDLHDMRESLWDTYSIKKRAGDMKAAKPYLDAWSDVTKYLDEKGPAAYKQARQKYKADSDILESAELGSELFKQNPADFKKRLQAMGAEERTALARGFYGQLEQMNDPRFLREVVGKSPAYANQRELLSSIFPDTQSLNAFLKNLDVEGAMLASKRTMGAKSPPSPPDWTSPHEGLWQYLKSWPSERTSRKRADLLFGEPQVRGSTMSFPGMGQEVERAIRPRAGLDSLAFPSAVGAGTAAWPYVGINRGPLGTLGEEEWPPRGLE